MSMVSKMVSERLEDDEDVDGAARGCASECVGANVPEGLGRSSYRCTDVDQAEYEERLLTCSQLLLFCPARGAVKVLQLPDAELP